MNKIDIMQSTANWIINNNTGYDQYERWSVNPSRDGKTLYANKETDCSAFCGIVAKSAYPELDIQGTFYTGNMLGRFISIGWLAIPFQNLTQCKPGDIILNHSHHVEFVGLDGRFGSAGIDERNQATGGQSGNQTGYETRWVSPYVYNYGGWDWIIRPPEDKTRIPSMIYQTIKGRSVDWLIAEDEGWWVELSTAGEKEAGKWIADRNLIGCTEADNVLVTVVLNKMQNAKRAFDQKTLSDTIAKQNTPLMNEVTSLLKAVNSIRELIQ